jgi:hypothetical protein
LHALWLRPTSSLNAVQGILKLLRSIAGIAILGTFIYVFVNWQSENSEERGNRGYAESACLTEIHSRFSTQSARVYQTAESDKGYVVRASVTYSNGKPAKIICLTNEFGRVEDVRIEER